MSNQNQQINEIYSEYPAFLPELRYWKFLPDMNNDYIVGVDHDDRIQVYSLRSGIKQLSQDKRKRGYYVRLVLNGKRTWRSVKKLYRSAQPRGLPPHKFEKNLSNKAIRASNNQLEQALKDGEKWEHPLVEGRIIKLREYAVTTSHRVFSLKGGRVTEVAQTTDDNGSRVRLYYDGKEARPYVHTLVRDVFGDPRSYDPRKTVAGKPRKMNDLNYYAHLSVYTDGRESDWYGKRSVFVKEYGRETVRQAEAKAPQFVGSTRR